MKNKVYLFFFIAATLFVVACAPLPYKEALVLETPKAQPSQIIELKDEETYTVTASRVLKNINGKEYEMYAYNNMSPGPLLKVVQGSRVKINLVNNLDQNTTIHWHGLRHNVKDDGVPLTPISFPSRISLSTFSVYFPLSKQALKIGTESCGAWGELVAGRSFKSIAPAMMTPARSMAPTIFEVLSPGVTLWDSAPDASFRFRLSSI